MAKFHAIIPAAGAGSRMGAELPKQYLALLGQPVIQHTLAVFDANPRIHSITLVLSSADTFWDAANINLSSKTQVLYCGGATRAATVLNGLQALQGNVNPDDWILVHDAVRPGLSAAMLTLLLEALETDPVGGLLAIPLTDTLKRADREQRVMSTEPRDDLWQAQTPQMFRYGLLTRALQQAGSTPTDEAQAVEALGFKPKLVSGELRNLKITYPQDLALVEALLAADMKENSQ
jgi:2-C-methyl-D-erythritol 4-phosphate cytidylyltransferase